MNEISGKYKGYSRVLLIVSMLLVGIYPFVLVDLLEDWTDSTDSMAGFFAAISPYIAGFVTGYFTFRMPCRFTADEKSFTISMGGTKRVFRIGEISEIRCDYRKHYENTRTKVTLTVTDCAGRTARFAEIHYNSIEYLQYEKDDKKPQLTRLCEYVRAIKGWQSEGVPKSEYKPKANTNPKRKHIKNHRKGLAALMPASLCSRAGSSRKSLRRQQTTRRRKTKRFKNIIGNSRKANKNKHSGKLCKYERKQENCRS